MEKIEKGNPLSQSADIVKNNIDVLKQLFPTIVKEGKIDLDELKALLDEEIDTSEEYYRFSWAGKSEARREANKPSTATLRPKKEDSENWDTTGNIFIEGDNLEVLKLLQKSYAGKIKMMYFDPPYNTGNDFVYKDNYTDNLTNYFALTGQTDAEGKKLSTNNESDGRFHSNWLNMIYPRLKLARNLLADDGAIFISIGVEEFSNLKSIMNEIFGEDNFVEIFSWVKTSTPPALSTKSRKTNEYIICYEKSKNNKKYNGELLDGGDQPLLNSGNSRRILTIPKDKLYFKQDKFPDGLYIKYESDRVKLVNDIEILNGYSKTDVLLEGEFKWTQDFLNEEIIKGTTFIIKSELLSIRFLRDEEGSKRPTNFIKDKIISPLINKNDNNVGTNESAGAELELLLGTKAFDFPKPVSLIKYLAGFQDDKQSIVLDIFAGSGTTAHSVMLLNTEDGGNRKFIMVQLDELLDVSNGKTEAEKQVIRNGIEFLQKINKPLNIAEISKERIRRAAKKIQKEISNDIFEHSKNKNDFGFKAFKLDSSNIHAWDGSVDNFERNLLNAETNIKEDRTEEDVLFEILLKYGLDLTVPIEEKEVNSCRVYSIGGGVLFICLSDQITTEVVTAIGKWKEELQPATCRTLFKDNGFKDDIAKTNSIQILRQYGIEEANSI